MKRSQEYKNSLISYLHSLIEKTLIRSTSALTPDDDTNPKCGMVMDFGVLKSIVNEEVVSRFDHALVLRATRRDAPLRAVLAERFGNIVTVDYQPTCENMLGDFARRISRRLPEGVELHSLRLHETATSFAEWFAEDNR